MTTLIAVYDSGGCVGRCDAKCYEAQETQCDCICHGKNHGAGLKQATDNTRELCEDWMNEYTQAHGLQCITWEVPAIQPVQLILF